jgi:hypothetical protein
MSAERESNGMPGELADGPETEPSETPMPPPDPAAYDTERSAAARSRGVAAPYSRGGRYPHQAAAEREDRRYLRWLLIMVVAIILAGFALGMVAVVAGLGQLAGG